VDHLTGLGEGPDDLLAKGLFYLVPLRENFNNFCVLQI
jgi:hypothetical protein